MNETSPSNTADLKSAPSLPASAVSGDKRYRSLLKAVSWRATGTVDTILISFLVTGKIKLAVSIGFIELFTKIFLYYLHERAWDKFSFGRTKPGPEYQI